MAENKIAEELIEFIDNDADCSWYLSGNECEWVIKAIRKFFEEWEEVGED